MIFRCSDSVRVTERKLESGRERKRAESKRMESNLNGRNIGCMVLTYEGGILVLRKFKLEMDRKNPYFRGLRSLNGLLIKIVGAMSNF